MRREHPLADRSQLTPLDLAEEQWIATFDSTICRQWLRRLFDGVSNSPRIVHESMEFENHLELVRAGLGVALMPRMGRPPLHPDLVAVPTVWPASTRVVSAVHRRSQADSPVLRGCLDAVERARPGCTLRAAAGLRCGRRGCASIASDYPCSGGALSQPFEGMPKPLPRPNVRSGGDRDAFA
ncbi:LysR substrate-binding domain-containing protein [Agromyces sp. M3QZ16-3]|uniref:LysR substrate-binding domain-containing protein n=1 Tax=Agromyces sp. M3QZ16-3 TaxID=3447585 RepID=UPI003F68E160